MIVFPFLIFHCIYLPNAATSHLLFCTTQNKKDTKYFDKDSLSTTNYIAWRNLKLKNNPTLIPETKNCYKNHRDHSQFVVEIYLEFCDRQYAKNTGYKHYWEEDFSFVEIKDNFTEAINSFL